MLSYDSLSVRIIKIFLLSILSALIPYAVLSYMWGGYSNVSTRITITIYIVNTIPCIIINLLYAILRDFSMHGGGLARTWRWPNSRPTIILFHLCRLLLGLIFRKPQVVSFPEPRRKNQGELLFRIPVSVFFKGFVYHR